MDSEQFENDITEEEPKVETTRLPFSIESLLADKFEKNKTNEHLNEETAASSSAVSKDEFYPDDEENQDDMDDDDDDKSTSSEQVDVVSSNASDVPEFGERSSDYQQSGKSINVFI